mgnify:CR=1 FL=1
MKALVTLMSILAGSALADPMAGVTEIELHAPHHDRSMKAAIWYPTQDQGAPLPFAENAVFHGTEVLRGAAPIPGQYPVVLLSHGMGGNYMTLQWLAAGLAERGALVLTVNHPNSSTWDFDMAQGARHGTRAMDMRHALDWLQGSDYAGLTDDRVLAAGFSYGGWTALSLGGVRGNLAGYRASCAAWVENGHCRDLERLGVDLGALDERVWNADYSDARITGVVAIDPGLHWGLSEQDVAGLDVPVRVIGLGTGSDRLFATDVDASGFSAMLPKGAVRWLSPASHFAMLPVCKADGAAILKAEKDDPVCDDPEGADRAFLHGLVLEEIVQALGL